MSEDCRRLPGVLILGGTANALSVARSLGRKKINVSIAAERTNVAAKSRYVSKHYVRPEGVQSEDFYTDLLLSDGGVSKGTVVFACGDNAICAIAKNREKLADRYILDIHKSGQQLDLLDKQKTLEMAAQVNCPVPRFWHIENMNDVVDAADDIEFPVLIKPVHSHVFRRRFMRKLFIVDSREALMEKARKVLDAGIAFILSEFIPGPDSLLSSYYVYIDSAGSRLFEFTKQVERRSPIHSGGGTYHRTQWLPETAEMGRRFFEGIRFSGLGNIEFKLDTRDGQLKVIECNARFTAAQELVTRSGIDMPAIVYDYLVHGIKPAASSFRNGLTMLLPFEDLDAYRDLRARGDISFPVWLKSLMRPHVFSYFSVYDVKPFLYAFMYEIKKRMGWALSKHVSRKS